jgi:CO/xanthine dehydrogenase FAD-binding subunit
MKDFEYFAPKTVGECLSLLSRYGEEAKIIAGGQSMLVVMRQGLLAPEVVIDIKGLPDLDYISWDERKGLKIGALTTHRAIEKSPIIQKRFRVLSEMETTLATIQTRNWGTIGGNLCHGDPAGDPAAVLLALDARLKIKSLSGERMVAVENFGKNMLEVDLSPDEMLLEIQVPIPTARTGIAHEKLMVMHGDAGIVGASVSITLSPKDGICEEARIALSNAAHVSLRANEAEKRLVGKAISDALLLEAGQVAAEESDPPADLHATAEYRREMLKVFVRRVARKALERARSGSLSQGGEV